MHICGCEDSTKNKNTFLLDVLIRPAEHLDDRTFLAPTIWVVIPVARLERASVPRKVDRLEVDTFDGLLVDYAKARNARIILRGLRALSDFEFEFGGFSKSEMHHKKKRVIHQKMYVK